ncbi:flagellar protein FlaG [Kordiimonas laminariae]|uniref:flagellar protein FlaG n=1 Tax=Kordiimonas laminariae TaxID=2917717 RepID=UPI001FF144FA|nr:flagellar protein FlaG [Kordiimonas laminariae]MCK0070499.1 flagellar protein FlaG [Kordiimonas laminariae]
MAEISNINARVQVPEPRQTNTPRVTPPEGNSSVLAADQAPSTNEVTANTIVSVDFTGEQGSPLEQAARAIEEIIPEEQTTNTRLRIDRDEETGRFIYKNIDTDTGEVVSQFPLESILEIVSQFREPEGLILDDEA